MVNAFGILLKQKNVKQAQVAEALGIPLSSVSGLTRGTRKVSAQEIKVLAKLLSVPTTDIFDAFGVIDYGTRPEVQGVKINYTHLQDRWGFDPKDTKEANALKRKELCDIAM